jgi:hypothetical protein
VLDEIAQDDDRIIVSSEMKTISAARVDHCHLLINSPLSNTSDCADCIKRIERGNFG